MAWGLEQGAKSHLPSLPNHGLFLHAGLALGNAAARGPLPAVAHVKLHQEMQSKVQGEGSARQSLDQSARQSLDAWASLNASSEASKGANGVCGNYCPNVGSAWRKRCDGNSEGSPPAGSGSDVGRSPSNSHSGGFTGGSGDSGGNSGFTGGSGDSGGNSPRQHKGYTGSEQEGSSGDAPGFGESAGSSSPSHKVRRMDTGSGSEQETCNSSTGSSAQRDHKGGKGKRLIKELLEENKLLKYIIKDTTK